MNNTSRARKAGHTDRGLTPRERAKLQEIEAWLAEARKPKGRAGGQGQGKGIAWAHGKWLIF